MSKIRCFLIEPSDTVELSLRRFNCSMELTCADGRIHEASVILGQEPAGVALAGLNGLADDSFDHADPRWPKACAVCGHVFAAEDCWQARRDRMWKVATAGGPEVGSLVSYHRLPVGAMWHSDWLPAPFRGPDGLCLSVQTPGGEWCIDAPPSGNGSRWVREGPPPGITVRPSILCGRNKDGTWKYHGFLTDGYLVSV